MKIVHVVFESVASHKSGAPIRNKSIADSLSRIAQLKTIVVQNYFVGENMFPDRKRSHIEADIPLDIVEEIASLVKEETCDLVVVDGVFLADICTRLVEAGENVILDMHNIESALLREIDRSKYGFLSPIIKAKRWKRARAADKSIAEMVKEVWVCSDDDAELLQSLTDNPPIINVLHNPIPGWCQAIEAKDRNIDGKIKLLFVAHLRYRPNIRAINRLLNAIFPKIQAEYPDAELTICGRNPSDSLRQQVAQMQGVTLIGDPVDLRPYYADATMIVAPITEGGGTRIKVLEAIAIGLPIVATPKTVEGLNLDPNEMFLEAHTDDAFVDAIRQLSSDEELRNRLVSTSQKFIAKNYAPEIFHQTLAEYVTNAIRTAR